jgi:hypothetical protein
MDSRRCVGDTQSGEHKAVFIHGEENTGQVEMWQGRRTRGGSLLIIM